MMHCAAQPYDASDGCLQQASRATRGRVARALNPRSFPPLLPKPVKQAARPICSTLLLVHITLSGLDWVFF
jgi:hypothetical protein